MATTGNIYATTQTNSTTNSSWTNPGNVTGATDTSRALWSSTIASASCTIIPAGYGLQAAIHALTGAVDPASVDSIAVTVVHHESNTTRIDTVTVEVMDGATPVGSSQSLTKSTTTDTTQTLTFTGVSWANLASFGVRLVSTRSAASGGSSSTQQVNSVAVDVTYTPSAGSPASGATLAGTGSTSTAGEVGRSTGATLSGTGTISAGATAAYSGTAALAGTGAVAATGLASSSVDYFGTAARTGTGTITATGTVTTMLDPWVSGASGEALLNLTPQAGVLEVTYPATPAPAAITEVALSWQSHESATIGGDSSGMESVPLGVPHVWVDGVDVTYFRDVPCKIAGWRQESPFGWTSTTLTFPQIFHYEERGTGDLSWLREDAAVEIALVRDDDTRIHRFTGHLTSDDPGTGRGRTESVWGVEGLLWQADHVHHEVPARLDPKDIGTLIPDELNGTPSRRFSTIAHRSTGITSRKRGSQGQTRWEYVTDHLATALNDSGEQWSIDPTGPRSFAMDLKDTTTVHWTITAGAPGVDLDLSHDSHERIDAVYGTGVGPDGYAWRNVFFPDLLPYDPPDYPYSDPDQNVLLGDSDGDTLTGTGISDWQRRINDLGYKGLPVDGTMGSEDIAAVRWIQKLRGIQVDGFLGPQTWAATWNIGTVGGDLTTIRLPLAFRPEVEKYLYGANGAIVGENPVYDASIIRHEVDIDFGAGVTKAQGKVLAQKILDRGMDPGIAGSIKLTTCPWEGSRWEINAGDNVLLKGFRGEDVLMRVAALDADPESLTVSLTVDSEFRDAMAVVQILERNRESKADPARRPGNPSRRSRQDQDMVTPFEGESPAGRIPRMALFEGLWTVWPVPVCELGVVAKLRFTTTGPATKFAIAIWGRDITANQIAAKVPNPLAVSNPWDVGDDWLDARAFIDGWGEEGQAAGYGLLGSESEGSSVNGKLIDDAGFPFVSAISPWLWVAMWSPVSCYIEGRLYPDPVQ